MKVLLVEDNERVSTFVRKGLTEAGHTIDHADNGRDGMFLAARLKHLQLPFGPAGPYA